MARLNHKAIVYPTVNYEYHIVTPVGRVHAIFEHNLKDRALVQLATAPKDWVLIEVMTQRNEIARRTVEPSLSLVA